MSYTAIAKIAAMTKETLGLLPMIASEVALASTKRALERPNDLTIIIYPALTVALIFLDGLRWKITMLKMDYGAFHLLNLLIFPKQGAHDSRAADG